MPLATRRLTALCPYPHGAPERRERYRILLGLHKTQNTKQNKTKKTFKTYYTEPGKCFICVLFFPPAGFWRGNINIQPQRYVTMAIIAVDRRRNRLGHGKSNMLVGLFHNLRLLKRMRKLLYTEQCVGSNDEDEKQVALLLCCLPYSLVVSCKS